MVSFGKNFILPFVFALYACTVSGETLKLASGEFEQGSKIFIEGKIAGQPVVCVLDSSNEYNYVSSHLKEKVGKLRPFDEKNKTGPWFCDQLKLQIGEYQYRSGKSDTFVVDKSKLKVPGRKIDVVLGVPFLKGKSLKVDFLKNRFQIVEGSIPAAGKQRKIHFHPERPMVPFVAFGFAGEVFFARLECECTRDLALPSDVFDIFYKSMPGEKKTKKYRSPDGVIELRSMNLEQFPFAGKKFENIEMEEGQEENMFVIGFGIFTDEVVICDFEKNVLSIE